MLLPRFRPVAATAVGRFIMLTDRHGRVQPIDMPNDVDARFYALGMDSAFTRARRR